MPSSFATLWTVAHRAPRSVEFHKQEHWNGLPFPPPSALPDPGIKLLSPALAGRLFAAKPPGKPHKYKDELRDTVFVHNIIGREDSATYAT